MKMAEQQLDTIEPLLISEDEIIESEEIRALREIVIKIQESQLVYFAST